MTFQNSLSDSTFQKELREETFKHPRLPMFPMFVQCPVLCVFSDVRVVPFVLTCVFLLFLGEGYGRLIKKSTESASRLAVFTKASHTEVGAMSPSLKRQGSV